jgi:thiamine biosynthesis protein ThiS
MITVSVNNKETVLPEATTVAELLKLRGVKNRSSVWINGTQLLLSEYDSRVLQNSDAVKILRVVAGG